MGPLRRLLQRSRAFRGSITPAGLRAGAEPSPLPESFLDRASKKLWRGSSAQAEASTPMATAEGAGPTTPAGVRGGANSARFSGRLVKRAKKLWRGQASTARTPMAPADCPPPLENRPRSKTRGRSTAESLKSIDRRIERMERQSKIKWIADGLVSVMLCSPERRKEYWDTLKVYVKKLTHILSDSTADKEVPFVIVMDPW